MSSSGFFLVLRPHSMSFTRAQGIPKHMLGLGRGRHGELGSFQYCVDGGGQLCGPVSCVVSPQGLHQQPSIA